MEPDLTIVTACDADYFWGAFLLVASLRLTGILSPIHVLEEGFSEAEKELLAQFGGLTILPLPAGNRRNLCTRKAEALLGAESEWIAWLDSDCVSIGDLRPLLIPPNGAFQIRIRSEAETNSIYRRYYEPEDKPGQIPKRILNQWRDDVGDLKEPRFLGSCVTNVLVIHRRFRSFIERWNEQILKVIPPVREGITRRSDPAYLISDESVLNSVLAFSSDAPPCGEYVLDRDGGAHIAHFVEAPKPWVKWKLRHWDRYNEVLDLLDRVVAKDLRLPPLPMSFQRAFRPLALSMALADGGKDAAKVFARRLMRR